MANDRVEALKGVIIMVFLLVLVVVADPLTLWFAFTLAWTFWGIYSAWWFVVFLFLTVVSLGALVTDRETDPRQPKRKKWGIF